MPNDIPISDPINDYYYMAKSAERAERYTDAVGYIKSLVELGSPLSDEARNLFQLVYKFKLTSRRSLWKILNNIEEQHNKDKNMTKVELLSKYLIHVEGEVKQICDEALYLIDTYLLPKAEDESTKVFYMKMEGDFCRYVAETKLKKSEQERSAAIETTLKCYQQATDLAQQLHIMDPSKIGLALNFSVFYYEIAKNTDQASKIAKKTYDASKRFLGSLAKEDRKKYEDSFALIQLLFENLTTWNPDDNDNDTDTDVESRNENASDKSENL